MVFDQNALQFLTAVNSWLHALFQLAPDKQTQHLPPSCAKALNKLLTHFLLGSEYRLRILGGTSKAYSYLLKKRERETDAVTICEFGKQTQ